MSEGRPCMRPIAHLGYHTPDLTGMQFHNLHVVALGKRHIQPSGRSLITWTCCDDQGRIRPNILVLSLIYGRSRGLHGPNGAGSLDIYGYRRVQHEGRAFKEHRLVMAKILGRPLRSDEDVHHGPKGRACNDPDNLSVRLKGKHPTGYSVKELADWLRSLGCQVSVPAHLLVEAVS